MRNSGFTLIELAGVVAVLIILLVALAPRIQSNRAAQFYAEAQNIGFEVSQAINNYLMQDPDRKVEDLVRALGLGAGTPPPLGSGVPTPTGSLYDCSRGGDLNPAVRWKGAQSNQIVCTIAVLSPTEFRVYSWWTGDTRKVFAYP